MKVEIKGTVGIIIYRSPLPGEIQRQQVEAETGGKESMRVGGSHEA